VITDEQIERWHKRTCSRCGRHGWFAAVWPDGPACRTCADRAVRTRGVCPGCGAERALPGWRPGDGAAICADCAGFTTPITCSRCGFEGKLHARRLCSRCTLADRLDELLDDGTGRIRPELAPLTELLLAAEKPLSILTWLYSRKQQAGPADLLRRLGRCEIALTHEAFNTLHPWRAAAHLQELLTSCGVLPAVDKQICSLERWLSAHLATITSSEHAQLIRRFATWEVLPRLRGRAERAPVTQASRYFAKDQIKHATGFLAWLADRGLALEDCRQADVDLWHAGHHTHARNALRSFLNWSIINKLTPRAELPPQAKADQTAPLPEPERLAQIGRLLTDDEVPLRSRVAGLIFLLYAQPMSRIVRLGLDDVLNEDGQVLLRLGTPPTPVPEPVAELLLRWVEARGNMNTATNRGSTWLFPGRRAGQPMHPRSMTDLVNEIGITVAGRAAAIRQHILETPAPVVADALTYHYVTTARLAAETGGDWSRYAAGDHTRSPAGWTPHRTDSS
jgi:integrase